MDLDLLKSKLQELHVAILGRQLDNKSLTYWANAVNSSNKSVKDFEQTLLNGDEYKKYICKKFRSMYLDMIGFDIANDEYDDFCNAFKGVIVSDSDIFNYITDLPQFDEKYIALIKDMYSYVFKEPCSIATLNFYLGMFKNDPLYNVDTLTEDLNVKKHQTSLGEVNEHHEDKVHQPCMYAKFGKDIEAILGVLPTNTLDWFTSLKAASNMTTPILNTQCIQDFEDVFKRPMFVQEYFKYIVQSPSTSKEMDDFQALYNSHVSSYNKMRELAESYTWTDLAEYDYIKRYLYDVDHPQFFENIIDEVIQSDDYHACMRKCIENKYKELYDEDLEKSDIEYIFEKVKALKLNRYDDKLSIIITNVKKETDDIISNIFQTYFDVLERQPDVYEIEEHVAFYRSNLILPMEEINAKLEKQLMVSLEYHDIIKKKIKDLYKEKHGNDALPSIIYSVLQKSVPKLPSYTIKTVDNLIKSCF